MKVLLFFSIYLCCNFVFSQENWSYLPIEITNNYHGAIYPIDENVVHIVSDYGLFYKTTDGGETWTQFDSGVNEYFFDLSFNDLDNGYAVGNNGKILKTSNAGQTWTELSSVTGEALISVAINAPNSIWAVGENGTVLHSENGGASWVIVTSLTTENLNDIKFKNENIGYIAGDNGVLLYTENGGNDWVGLSIPSINDLFGISLIGDFIYLLSGYATTYTSEYGFSGEQLLKSNNNIDWSFNYLNTLAYGPAHIYFTSENLGYSINSATTVSNRCFVVLEKTTNNGEIWEENYIEENASGICHSNDGYAKINFPSEDVGYVLLGGFILKTPYDRAGIEDFNRNNAFTIYPNPSANGKFNLKINATNVQNLSMEISDVIGKKMYSEKGLMENYSISLPNLSEGIYFVRLMNDEKLVATKKIIKD